MADDLFWGLILLGALFVAWGIGPAAVIFLAWLDNRAVNREIRNFDADAALREMTK